MNKHKNFLPRLLISSISSLLILSAANSYADDTEIFFAGPAIGSNVRPNVLFVLDNSGSMAWRTDEDDSYPSGSQKSRMAILKQAFGDIISTASNINAGIMVLNPRSAYNNTRMVYPITNIDQPLTSISQIASQPEILQSDDDATQVVNVTPSQRAVADSASLLMGNILANQPTNQPGTNSTLLENAGAFLEKSGTDRGTPYKVACSLSSPNRNSGNRCDNDRLNSLNIGAETAFFIFKGLNLPSSATITNAWLEVTPTNTQSTAPTIGFALEQDKTPDDPNDGTSTASRTFPNNVNSSATTWRDGTATRFRITDQLNTLKGIDPVADQIGDLVIRFKANSTTNYSFCARRCSETTKPRIYIEYTTQVTAVESRMGALRFQNVGIPRGATIQSARIDFVPASSSDVPVTFEVRAEKVGDATAFSNTSDLTTRTTTSALTTWAAPAWVNNNPAVYVEGPDVTSAVQEVVNLGGTSGWCGNNSMAFYLKPTAASTGTRTARSIDGGIGLQPVLNVQYTGGSGGCLNPIVEARVIAQKNDGHEDTAGSVNLAGEIIPMTRSLVGARFENLQIRQGATVLSAKVLMTPQETTSDPSVSTSIAFERANSSAQFTTNARDLSGRTKTTGSTCTIDNNGGGWTAGHSFTCTNASIATELQSIFARSGWAPGSALSLFVTPTADNDLKLRSFETSPTESIRLVFKVASGDLIASSATVRQHLNALVQAMTANDSTPIVPTLDEAVKYYRGERQSFDTPITSACQPNHLVLLTDGQANENTSGTRSSIAALTGSCSGDATNSGEQCGRTLMNWVYNNDVLGSIADKQTITTHTIGFALNAGGTTQSTNVKAFLRDMASPISENSTTKSTYTAEDYQGLANAFSKIIQSVMSTDTTFVSPGATVNQFNRQNNKNEVYFALFKPTKNDRWPGNVKRYKIFNNTGEIILDADNIAAIDPRTGFFVNDARSVWTTGDDGNNTELGGVAKQIPLAADRKVFTFIGNSPTSPVNLNQANYLLNTANTTITRGNVRANDDAERTELINWIRGNDNGVERRTLGDPLHSVPRLVTYGCVNNDFTDDTLTGCRVEDQSLFVGTNEGFVHAFNTNTGAEQLAFMPEQLLLNIRALKRNEESTTVKPRLYGMDNTVVVWANDVNKNGVIFGGKDPSSTTVPPAKLDATNPNANEFVYAFATMGRGGRNLYSLDVTNRASPQMRWLIKGGETTGFERLGQTWSTPVVTSIQIGAASTSNPPTDVIMFAGGYDTKQDTVTRRTADDVGNSIYIVNARTGQLIWSASSVSGHTMQLNKMIYSIPSSLRVIDVDRDGKADQFFVGDMGGQIWRFFINNGSDASGLVTPVNSDGAGSAGADDGVFANVIAADTGSENATNLENKLRRFYNEPDVALLNVNGTRTMVVNIGSGYRGHPLNEVTLDRFYSFRTPLVANPGTNAANDHTVLTESDLYDATSNLIQTGTSAESATAAAAFRRTTGGWYIRLPSSGEKVLAEATTFGGKVFFNTYSPAATARNTCRPVQGTGREYSVNLYDATPALVTTDGNVTRSQNLLTGGIPPKPVILFPEGANNGKGVKCTATECDFLEADVTVGKTYWIDEY
ncbi:pilus assembly protein PilY [Pseudomonas taiwanensis]|uniref:pilus assembly protein n=1 Tax=Pseudomonas taiwanensis TaxID=470150 RepID=UPI0015C187ED|nr:PilC/PilY family type IV pilus protein [Pseudomonas taiwanensis]NWL79227.1 pilus assembly protein PilY [Pseudomonas taiwanensis]